jgi:hypothetical protein
MKGLLLALLLSGTAITAVEASSAAAPLPAETYLALCSETLGTSTLATAAAFKAKPVVLSTTAEPSVKAAGSQLTSTDCVHLRYYYYEYWGAPSCGYTYVYCESPSYHHGCETPYYNVYAGCACP